MKKIIRKNGFSLIELLVVMGIIAVLAALVTYNFNSARARARDLQRKNDLKSIQQAMELYKNDNGQQFPSAATWDSFMTTLVNGSYIQKAYSDPKESLKTGSWQQYRYQRPTTLTYFLVACLENRSDENADKPLVNCGPGNSGVTYTVTQP